MASNEGVAMLVAAHHHRHCRANGDLEAPPTEIEGMALDDGNSELLPILPDREHQAAGVTGQDPDDGPISGDHCIRNYGVWQPLDGKASTS